MGVSLGFLSFHKREIVESRCFSLSTFKNPNRSPAMQITLATNQASPHVPTANLRGSTQLNPTSSCKMSVSSTPRKSLTFWTPFD